MHQRAFFWVVMSILALLFTACDPPSHASVEAPERVAPPIKGVSTAIAPGDWPTYLFNTEHSGYDAAETIINATTASRLKQHWMYHAHGGISVQLVEANGMIYWGSWDGVEHATDVPPTGCCTSETSMATSMPLDPNPPDPVSTRCVTFSCQAQATSTLCASSPC